MDELNDYLISYYLEDAPNLLKAIEKTYDLIFKMRDIILFLISGCLGVIFSTGLYYLLNCDISWMRTLLFNAILYQVLLIIVILIILIIDSATGLLTYIYLNRKAKEELKHTPPIFYQYSLLDLTWLKL